MCTNCIISNYPTCSFRGLNENCDQCKKGKHSKCTFKISPAQKVLASDLLAAATRGNHFGKPSVIQSFIHANRLVRHSSRCEGI